MRIAVAQHVDLEAARGLAVRDALYANEARALGLDQSADFRRARDAAIARALLRAIATEAEARGPVTDAELTEVTSRHWLELDRPQSFRTAHALVRFPKDATDEVRKQARAVAEAIREALRPVIEAPPAAPPLQNATDDPLFAPIKSAAEAVAHEGFELVTESLPPVAADGRLISERGGSLDLGFARAAAALVHRGDLSPPVETPFGVHVIVLLAEVEAQIVPEQERRALVRDEVMMGRARAAHDALLTTLRPSASVDLSAAAQLALVHFEP